MTITSTHSNYNFYTSQNTIQNTNSVQRMTQTHTTTNPVNSVTDKSQAVNKVLGYGVDSEGYFTSDFNEAAGLPKDYRIEAQGLNKFVDFNTNNEVWIFNTYIEIDIAQTVGNAYREFVDYLNNKTNEKYSSEKFDYDINNIINEFLQDNTLSKSEKLQSILNGIGIKEFIEFITGQSTIVGKILHYDNSISNKEMEEFQSFMNANRIDLSLICLNFSELSSWDINTDRVLLGIWKNNVSNITRDKELTSLASEIFEDYEKLINNNDLNLDGFKEGYLKIKEKWEDFIRLYEEKMGTSTQTTSTNSSNTTRTTNTKESEEENKKSFTPIQVKSKTQTYTREEINKEFFLNFIENQKENSVNILEFLNKFSPNLKVDLRV